MALRFDGFQIFIPAFMVGHLMHRLSGHDPELPLFLRDQAHGAGHATTMRLALQVIDGGGRWLPAVNLLNTDAQGRA